MVNIADVLSEFNLKKEPFKILVLFDNKLLDEHLTVAMHSLGTRQRLMHEKTCLTTASRSDVDPESIPSLRITGSTEFSDSMLF